MTNSFKQKKANALKPVARSGFDGEMVSKATEGVQNITISQSNTVSAENSAPGSPKFVPNNIHLQNNNTASAEEGSRTPSGDQQESTFSVAGGECKSFPFHFIFNAPLIILVDDMKHFL